MIEIGGYPEIDELLDKAQLLLRHQLDSIVLHRGVERRLERLERSDVIGELLAHLQFLRELRDEMTPKHRDDQAHPISVSVEQKDRILNELSTLIKEKVEHIEDLTNPYAREMYYERNGRIRGLLNSLKAREAIFPRSQTEEHGD
jgi:uncharacterized coiled-coil DUF342 family protein